MALCSITIVYAYPEFTGCSNDLATYLSENTKINTTWQK